MIFENIEVILEDKIACITINRPKQLNALNSKTLQELNSCFKSLEEDSDVKVIIITGSGDKSFVAGADIKEFLEIKVDKIEEFAHNAHNSVFNLIENLSKPVIAAVNGFALGGGLELAMACHIRIASDNARLGLPEVTLGLIPGYGGTQRLPKLVGKGIANQIIFTAEMITAQRAFEIGLVNEIVPQADLLDRAKELAAKIAKNSSVAIEQAIKAVNASDKLNGFDVEISCFSSLFTTDDFKEGVNAFIEKRKPSFA